MWMNVQDLQYLSFYSHCFGFDVMNSLCYCLLLVLDPTDGRLPGTCVAAIVGDMIIQ